MEQFKIAKIVMLATNEKTKHLMVYSDVEKTKGKLILNGLKNDEYKEYQHLYIISDDEIKKGDNFYNPHSGHLHISGNHTDYKTVNNNGCKKIIATTDPLLKIEINGNRGNLLPDVSFDINLPQPSQQFIQKFVEEYNKGNVITDVLIEYEYLLDDMAVLPYWKLKINTKDNTITIKKLKDSYTRQEVDRMLDEQASKTTAEMLEKFKDYKSKEEVYTKEELCQVLEKYTSFIWSEVGIHYPISLGIDAKDKFINSEL